MTENIDTIIKAAKAGDAYAFRQILEEYYDVIYRVSYRFLGSAVDAQDNTQEVCVALVGKLASYSGKSSFSTWLYSVTVNACRDYIKKNGNRRRLENNYVEIEEQAQSDKKDSDKKTAWLYRKIAELDEPLKETSLLVIAEELNHAEAGKILGCAESTISWRISEVKKILRKELSDYHE